MKVEELKYSELIDIAGGGSGSENGARIFGRVVGYAIGFPFSGVYYAGRDLELW